MNVALKLIALALDEVGYHEGRDPNGNWNNDQKYSDAVPGLAWSDRMAWCQTFQSWLAWKAGSAAYEPRTASCATAVAWFAKAGRFSYYPAIGAQVFYGPGGGSHVGRVIKYDRDYIWTVEGNTNDSGSAQGDGVYQLKHERRSARVYGYGLPAFPEGIVTADPALKGKPGYTFAETASGIPAAPKPVSKPVVSVAHINAARAKDIPAATGHTTYPAEVKIVEAALVAEGLLAKEWADGSWGTKTDDAFNAFRRRIGLTGDDAKGAVGSFSLGKLGAKHGFTVKS